MVVKLWKIVLSPYVQHPFTPSSTYWHTLQPNFLRGGFPKQLRVYDTVKKGAEQVRGEAWWGDAQWLNVCPG